jgi:uncharacterized membrane protein
MKRLSSFNFTGMVTLVILIFATTAILSACGSQAAVASATPRDPALPVSFSKDVMPILQTSCVKCHGGEKINRGLDMTTYEKLMTGSVKGPVIVAGNAENSTLFTMVQQGKMPKQGPKLTGAQLDIIKSWIVAGAQNN